MRTFYFLIICTLAFLASIRAWGQASPENGLLPEDDHYDTLPLDNERGIRDDLPLVLSLRRYCPEPDDQGDLAACVGWALAHALSIQARVQTGNHLDAFSASYIFNQIKVGDDCHTGAYLSAGLRLLREQGVCLRSTFQNSNTNCQRLPTRQQRAAASPYRIAGYYRLFERKKNYDDNDLAKIKSVLSGDLPVIVGIKTPARFRTLPLDSLDWKPEPKDGHALVVIGYDERKHEVELMNSYGPGWGDKGFFRLSYRDFLANLMYAFWLDTGAEFGKAAAVSVSKRE